ncbi:hypothetical protein [Algibacter mikhailovii]|uniref:hypothetical protein n=1 Tax=Algibacter mikhailovii TaxID=425498 RepID=UPI0024950351|nr:hypothetical protein [Algibacter mikhailovii]
MKNRIRRLLKNIINTLFSSLSFSVSAINIIDFTVERLHMLVGSVLEVYFFSQKSKEMNLFKKMIKEKSQQLIFKHQVVV